ncbi:Bug family tripartite tricarboxylate transporter substrate binding protein [Arenibaculum pallidiluteum]|uniref:Bug family tripartite tricarboxylate transporter substrate binding protein n=1 Tax=Arenibaculum pallidiluteum TaxID=2812559 RepID=UPI001A95FD4D|nr:tripartite tricarboxylate transporter substrate binding protein [Arenibaculum pallidiluteum]
MRRQFLSAVAAVAVTLFAGTFATPSQAAYPERPITLIVPWGAGGGTDATARIIGTLLEKELGQPVNVVNRTGGNGVVGHAAIAAAPRDGYTLGMATVEIGMLHWQGLTELTSKDYTPLALMNYDPAALQVRADAPYKNAKELVEAIKAQPGKFKASGTGQGGIWHLAIAGMLNELKIAPNAVAWVPSQGAAPGLQDLMAGGVEIVPCSLPEARSVIDAGRVKSLVTFGKEPNPAMPNIPTLKSELGFEYDVGAWRGIVGPKGLPKEVGDRLVQALDKIYKSEDYKGFMNQRGFGMQYAAGDQFGTFMADSDAKLGTVMKAVGIAK